MEKLQSRAEKHVQLTCGQHETNPNRQNKCRCVVLQAYCDNTEA